MHGGWHAGGVPMYGDLQLQPEESTASAPPAVHVTATTPWFVAVAPSFWPRMLNTGPGVRE